MQYDVMELTNFHPVKYTYVENEKNSLLHENTFAHALLNKAKIMQPKICFMIISLKNITHVSFKRQKMDRYDVFNISEDHYNAFS